MQYTDNSHNYDNNRQKTTSLYSVYLIVLLSLVFASCVTAFNWNDIPTEASKILEDLKYKLGITEDKTETDMQDFLGKNGDAERVKEIKEELTGNIKESHTIPNTPPHRKSHENNVKETLNPVTGEVSELAVEEEDTDTKITLMAIPKEVRQKDLRETIEITGEVKEFVLQNPTVEMKVLTKKVVQKVKEGMEGLQEKAKKVGKSTKGSSVKQTFSMVNSSSEKLTNEFQEVRDELKTKEGMKEAQEDFSRKGKETPHNLKEVRDRWHQVKELFQEGLQHAKETVESAKETLDPTLRDKFFTDPTHSESPKKSHHTSKHYHSKKMDRDVISKEEFDEGLHPENTTGKGDVIYFEAGRCSVKCTSELNLKNKWDATCLSKLCDTFSRDHNKSDGALEKSKKNFIKYCRKCYH